MDTQKCKPKAKYIYIVFKTPKVTHPHQNQVTKLSLTTNLYVEQKSIKTDRC